MKHLRKILFVTTVALALGLPVQTANAFCCGFFDGWGGGGFSFGFGFHGGGWGYPYWGGPWYGYPGWGYPLYGYGYGYGYAPYAYPFYTLPAVTVAQTEAEKK